MTTSLPKRLLLNVGVDGDSAGPCLAILTLTAETVDFMLKQFTLFNKVRRLDHGVYQITRFDYRPCFLELRGIATDLAEFEEERVDDLFESRWAATATNRGWALLPETVELPTRGMRIDYCILEVSAAVDTPYLRWRACIKHTPWEMTTADLTEADVRELLTAKPDTVEVD